MKNLEIGGLIDKTLLRQHEEALGPDKFRVMYQEAESAANEYLTQIDQALHNEDYEKLESSAHILAGLCANFGLAALDKVASKLENNATKREKSVLIELVEEIALVIEQTFQAIRHERD